MNEIIVTPEATDKMEEAQRNVARMAGMDAELVAVATMAFADGLAVGSARARQTEE